MPHPDGDGKAVERLIHGLCGVIEHARRNDYISYAEVIGGLEITKYTVISEMAEGGEEEEP